MYSSTRSLTSTLDEVGGQRRAATVFPLGKTQYQSYRGVDGPQHRSGRARKISPPPLPTGIRSPDRPALSESLHRLSYPDPPEDNKTRATITSILFP